MIFALKKHCQSLIKTLIISVLIVFCASCSKTTEYIGNGLLPENDHIGAYYTDSLQLVCHTERVDSLLSKNMSTVLFGSMMDPVMGQTNANIFMQLRLSSTNPHFGTDPQIDSVVLQLAYTGYYGDTTTMQTLHVNELSEAIIDSLNYYQFSDLAVDDEDLAGGFQFVPRPKTAVDSSGYAALRIPLSIGFGEHLVSADSATYSSSDGFKNFFHGLKLSCDGVGAGGAISYFNPTLNNVTKLEIYYRETPEAPVEQQQRYDFYITSNEVYFNQYLHDYTLGSSDFTQQVLDGDTLLGQTQLYLQSMGGVRSFISFSDLKDWATALQEDGSHLIINEAKLIIPAAAGMVDTALLTPPSSLALVSLKPEGGTSLLPDYMEGTSYYGGVYSSSTRSVTFRISEYLQEVILGNYDSRGLYLSIVGASYNAQRWVVAGPDVAEDSRLRCEIKYSLVKE